MNIIDKFTQYQKKSAEQDGMHIFIDVCISQAKKAAASNSWIYGCEFNETTEQDKTQIFTPEHVLYPSLLEFLKNSWCFGQTSELKFCPLANFGCNVFVLDHQDQDIASIFLNNTQNIIMKCEPKYQNSHQWIIQNIQTILNKEHAVLQEQRDRVMNNVFKTIDLDSVLGHSLINLQGSCIHSYHNGVKFSTVKVPYSDDLYSVVAHDFRFLKFFKKTRKIFDLIHQDDQFLLSKPEDKYLRLVYRYQQSFENL